MQYFKSDYMEGAHPLILERLCQTNMEKTSGYGTDEYCASARRKIAEACGCPQAEVHFMVGGTQTNSTVITALLRPYEGVIAAETGHINQHEAGAVEAGGHKVLALPHHEGKLDAAEVDRYVTAFYQDPSWDHMVAPGMVYISHPTEYGTLYTLDELKDLSAVCRKHKIPLFLDGARLGYGLAARDTDVTLKDIASLCDIFYIGGTKVGALFGEAVVIPQPGLIRQFDTIIKQRGVLLAKGRLLGLQFDTLFTDGLYLKIARHAIDMAERIVEGLKENGYTFYIRPQSNQLFVQLENSLYEKLAQCIGFEVWEKRTDGTTVVRIATSWATREEDVAELLEVLKKK
ncbi:threonine aldolase family protein [Phocaeicola plebeius]|uniref:threonine aldolase family protein n=1 Tax=Phocaeicola plebeius TaxID=310297 RepID=UPI003564224B